MKIDKVVGYVMGFVVGLLAVAPPLPFSIPVIINSEMWLYGFFVVAFLGVMALFRDIPTGIKIIIPYLFMSCFISQIPYVSFNSFILAVFGVYCFMLFQKSDSEILIDFVTGAFMLQICLGVMQSFGVDKLLNFNRPDPVFVGSVLQYMRFASLVAVMSVFVVLKDKRFIVPILLAAILSRSSSFAFAVVAGTTVYCFLQYKSSRIWIILCALFGVLWFSFWDRASIEIALTDGRITVWGDIVKSWVYDTSRCAIPVSRNYIHCPIDLKAIIFGHGLDSFLPLFPIYKQDPCPFPQAHNDFLQMFWELGLIGGSLFIGYLSGLAARLYKAGLNIYVAGMVCLGVNMFFAFPMRMVQTMLMLICYIAICEKEVNKEDSLVNY